MVSPRRALLSVSDKEGLVEFARGLRDLGFELIGTDGTAKTLKEAGLPVTTVADYTGLREGLGGRVKTLTPALYRAICLRGYRYDSSTYPAAPYWAAKALVMGALSLLRRPSRAILDRPAVNEQMLVLARRSRNARSADKAPDTDDRLVTRPSFRHAGVCLCLRACRG